MKKVLFFLVTLLLFGLGYEAKGQRITTDTEVGCSLDSPPEPNPDDSTSYIRVCSGSQVKFDANTTAAANDITWSVVGGTILADNGDKVTVGWFSAGAGSIAVKVITDDGVVTDTKCIEILQGPEARFGVLPDTLQSFISTCTYRELQFKDMSMPLGTSPIVAWNWSFGDGTYSNVPNPSHEYTSGGHYEVILEVVNSCNCRSEYMIEITVDEAEQLIIDCPSVVCEGEQARYTVQKSCGKYDWKAVGGTFQTPSNGVGYVDVIWDQVGSDGFGYLSVYNRYCGDGCEAPTTIKVPVIKSVGTIEGPTEICEGSSYLYRLPQWPATEFTWSKTGADIDIQPSDQPNEIIVTVNSATTSTATLRCAYNNDLVNCGGKSIKELKIRPSASISGPKLLCADEPYNYQLSNGFSGNWKVYKEGSLIVAHQGGPTNSFPITINDPGNYTVTVTGQSFCSPDPFAFEVLEKPAAPADLDGPTSVCPGIPYSYNTYPEIPGTTFNWKIVNGSFSNGQSITSGSDASATFSGNGPYALKIWRKYKNGTGCVSDTLTQVITREIVEPNIGGADTSCDNSYSLYTAAYSQGELYEWSIIPETHGSVTSGDGTQSVDILWNSLAVANDVDVVVKVRKCGSTYVDTMTVHVVPVSNVSINAPDSVCSGYNINISMNAGVPINSFTNIEWDFGDGTTTTSTTASTSHTYESGASTPLSYTIIMKLNNPNGCGTSVVKTKTITINPSPIANAFTNGPICASQPGDTMYAVIQSGAGATATFAWYEEGDTSKLNSTPKYVAPGYGTYFCVVTGNNGCVDTTNFVYVDANPCAPSTGQDSIGCDLCIGDAFSQYPITLSYTVSGCQEVTITASPQYPATYLVDENWKWGANPVSYNVSTPYEAVVKFDQVGTYKVTYRACHFYGKGAFDPDSVCYTFHDIYVEVPYVPDFKFDITCQPNGVYQVNVVDHSNYHPNASIDTYSFYVDNNPVQSGSNIMYTNTFTPGSYEIKMEIEGSGHPKCTIIDTLELPAFPVADFSFNFDGACMGYPIEFTNLSTPSTGLTYEWDFGDQAKSAVLDPSRVYAGGGDKPISLTVTNSLGCSDTFFDTVNVSNNNLAGAVSTSPVSGIQCDGGTIVLTANASQGTPSEYSFQPNSFAVVTHPTKTTSVFESGSYFVIMKDANECRFPTQSTTVEFVPSPNPQIEGPTDVCLGDSIHLFGDLGEGDFSYNWTLQGTPGSLGTDPNLTVYAGTVDSLTYVLNVSRNSVPQCFTNDVFKVEIHAPPASPNISFSLVTCQPYTIELNATASGTGTYTWSDGQSGPNIEVTEGGNFTVTYTNDWGCSSEAMVYIPKSPEEYVWIYPTGCYDLCPDQVNGSEEFDLPDPIISFTNWSLNDPIDPVTYGAAGSGSIPDIYLQTPYNGQYSFTLENDFCDYTARYFDLRISERCECEVRVDFHGSYYDGSPGDCRNYVDFYIDNPYGQPITVNLNSPNGIFVPSSILVPPGGTSVTVEFIPNPGYTGPMDTWMASTNIPHGQDEFLPCYMEGEYELPQPLCNDTSWYKQAAARTADDTDAEHSFSLAPNPAISKVGVIYDLPMWVAGSKGTIEVYNLQGVLMGKYEVTQASGTQMVQTEKWSPSVYIVLIRVNDRVVDYRRLAIQR
ncbi:PKD domain-containing protein [Owenweeksia hongkongensis]|uniref:PKD domain-containing protein n=1 Tax=Owenweeksia hongkongensis TaxID=253245 RepID=UPI003A95A375